MAKPNPIIETVKIMNALKKKGVIRDYAIWGAVAVMKYTEPFFTQDLDILVAAAHSGPVVLMTPIFDEFRRLGHKWKGEHIVVGDLPVQFMSAGPLELEAIRNARPIRLQKNTPAKVLSPEYLMALLTRAGRAKDKYKIQLLLAQHPVDEEKLKDILLRYRLTEKYEAMLR